MQKTNHALYLDVQKVLEKNKQERHIRGGIATRQKFLNAKKADHA
nr:sporulation transcriptional regulator SpoIIID [Merdimmobilis hominis]